MNGSFYSQEAQVDNPGEADYEDEDETILEIAPLSGASALVAGSPAAAPAPQWKNGGAWRAGPVRQAAAVIDRFGPSSTALSPQHKQVLRAIAARIAASFQSGQQVRAVRLVGHSDGMSETDAQGQLGLRRTQVVGTALNHALRRLNPHIPAQLQIKMHTHGASRPAASSQTPDSQALNRRVEIYLPRIGSVEREGPEAVAAGAAVIGTAFEILKSTLAPIMLGDVNFYGPTSQIGVIWANRPPSMLLNSVRRDALIINFRESSPVGIEQVNIKLRCLVQYDGPSVTATFSFDAEGRRSRIGRDTYITVNNPLSLETQPTPEAWRKAGIYHYPVVYVPVEMRVDRPWPMSNYNETFTLVLSGMHGFGKSLSEPNGIINRRVVWN